jgi:hypothetical protein
MITTASPIARGVLAQVVDATATKPGYIVFSLPGSSYQLHLIPDGAITSQVGKRLIGTITCQARRVDLTRQGGRFVEPLVGRPRRVQGIVIAQDAQAGTITVMAGGASAVDGPGLPVVLKLTDARHSAGQFPIGELVGCDVLDGGTFTPGA